MENLDAKTAFEEILGELGRGIGAASLSFDENGDCELLFGVDVVVNLHYDEELSTLLTYVVIADIDGLPDRDGMLLKMLRGNYFWQGNRGFTLCLDHDSDKVILMDRQRLDFFRDADFLATYLGACADTVYDWRKRINDSYLDTLEAMSPGNVARDGGVGVGDDGDGVKDGWMKI